MPIIKINKKKEYSENILKHLHDIELMILNDFIDFCNKHEITYYMDGGSLLGCIRHEGFIPWDDDIDVILFRDQYEKFIKYSEELTDKYNILNTYNYDYYCRLYSKLSLKGTRNYEIFEKNTDYTFGINIDIFVFDNIPNNLVKRKFFTLQRNFFIKLLWIYEVTTCDLYISKNKEKIGHIIRFIFKLFNINNKTIKKLGDNLINKSKKMKTNYVTNLSTTYDLVAFPKSYFKIDNKKFENLNVTVPKDFDKYLSMIYGDYMKLPPENERINHAFDNIEFGKY